MLCACKLMIEKILHVWIYHYVHEFSLDPFHLFYANNRGVWIPKLSKMGMQISGWKKGPCLRI